MSRTHTTLYVSEAGLFLFAKSCISLKTAALWGMNSTESQTAVITGASSGIGAAFARSLARRGYNLILTARRENRLKALADQLQARHGINVEIILADLTNREDITQLQNRLRDDASITMLINNAGFGLGRKFTDTELEHHLDMIDVHITAAVRLMHTVLPGMIARKRGDIINVASVAGLLPHIMSPLYGSTKSFLIAFSESFQTFLKEYDIHVQALCPGFTVTEFHDGPEFADFNRASIRKSMWLSADDVVEQSLAALGRRRSVFVPGWRYRLMVWLLRPRFMSFVGRRMAKSRSIKR